MNFDDKNSNISESIIGYWESNNLTVQDFYCRECGKIMLEFENLKNATFNGNKKTFNGKFGRYIESEQNRWLVKGRMLSNKIYFRHICWDCFFKKLPSIENISQRALKSSWYKDIKNGLLRPPAAWTSPSRYFKLLFDITNEELECEHKKFDTASLESFIRRYGKEIGTEKYNTYCKRQAYTCSKEYMMNEKGMTEKEWNKYNSGRSITLENLILKHGDELGSKMWKEYCSRQSYVGCKLDYFIEKYGDKKGKEVYERLNSQKRMTLDNFIRKYGVEEGNKKWELYLKKRQQQYSEISKKLFESIDRKDEFSLKNSRHASKLLGESVINIVDNGIKKSYWVDFLLGNKIIEFYGDYFHANPNKFKPTDTIFEKTASDIWEKNKHRVELLKSAGYDVKIIWESDYNKNKKMTVNECLEFLHGIN